VEKYKYCVSFSPSTKNAVKLVLGNYSSRGGIRNDSWDISVYFWGGTEVGGAYIMLAANRVVSKEGQILSI